MNNECPAVKRNVPVAQKLCSFCRKAVKTFTQVSTSYQGEACDRFLPAQTQQQFAAAADLLGEHL